MRIHPDLLRVIAQGAGLHSFQEPRVKPLDEKGHYADIWYPWIGERSADKPWIIPCQLNGNPGARFLVLDLEHDIEVVWL
jgi:hypothetical protein